MLLATVMSGISCVTNVPHWAKLLYFSTVARQDLLLNINIAESRIHSGDEEERLMKANIELVPSEGPASPAAFIL